MIDLGFFGLNTAALELPAELGWPFALALAWLVGEFGTRWTRLPRISLYGLVGFVLANSQVGFLSNLDNDTVLLLANIAFGLILFEFGYRINLQWLRTNPWIGANGLLDAVLSFIAVYWVAQWFGVSSLPALLIAALSMASSPAGVLRVINERRSSGQVSERILHLSAINSVLAVFTFKVILVLWVSHTSGNLLQASTTTLVVLAASTAIGLLFGYALPVILRRLGNLAQDSTVAFACAVILLVALTHSLKLSPILASLTFGLVARHRRITLNRTQRNFGALGDLLTVLLFVFAASTLEWSRVLAGLGLGAILVGVRLLSKILVSTALAPFSGISWRKGFFSGLGLAPISVFVVLTLEQSRYLGVALTNELNALIAMVFILEMIGPVLTLLALIGAKETPHRLEN